MERYQTVVFVEPTGVERVIRGNMIVYPLGNAFLYIEPLFMAAERNNFLSLSL